MGGREPLSEKKIRKGDADWTTRKEVLGWLVDGDARTVELPADKAAAYEKELRALMRKKKVPIKRFREIVGKLRFAALCLPAGRSLMTPFNMALRGDPKEIGLGKKGELHDCLGDWLALIRSLAERPTSVHEVVSIGVDYYGYCDACITGAGGVWLPLNSSLDPFVWRVEWPPDIVKKLAS